ncbi:MAG: tetratricopeptide repeat protein, partial [Acidobacteria bacterium]|nr:tetratricopeptide repeat protein [Acidobacteriota bacterium]
MQTNARSAITAQELKDARQLEPGKPIERELAGGKSHFYQIALVAGQYLDLAVEQKGIDVVVILIAPEGKSLAEMDSPNGSFGPESIRAIIEADGTYQLEIRSLEKDAKSGQYEMKIVDLRMATEKDRAWVEAIKLHEESESLSRQRKYDDALPVAERAVTIIEKAFGPEDRRMAPAISSLAALYQQKQDYAKVEMLDLRVLAIMEKTLGSEHPNVAIALTNLGRLNLMRADLDRAEQFFQRALNIREKTLGPEHLQAAISLGDLAVLFYEKDDHAKAESYYLRTLAILEKTLGPEHPHLAEMIDNLASLYRTRGEYSKAESLYQKALSIFEKSYGQEHPYVAFSCNNLAALYASRGDYAKAEALHQRALAIYDKTLGPDHIRVSLSLTNLAPLYEQKGDTAKAEQLYQRAISIGEKRFGPDHPDVAVPMTRLADLYGRKGDYKKSETLLQRVLEIVESKYGSDHPSVASALGNLARLYLAQGMTQQAIPLVSRSLDITEQTLCRNIIVGSDRQKSAYLSTFNAMVNDAISTHARHAPDDPQALQLAFKTILITKGRSLDAMSDALASLRRHATAQDQDLIDKLSKTLSQLATLTLRGRGNSPISVFREKLDQLKEQTERLEAEISARNAEFYSQTRSLSLSEIQSIIPPNTALVEFALYAPFDLKTNKPLPQRYLAYVLSSQGNRHWAELGEVSVINAAVEDWRKLLGNPSSPSARVKRQARELDEMIMRPIRNLVGNTKHILLSPDGDLNLIPFA